MEKSKTSLGERLSALRAEAGVHQAVAADAIGIARSTLAGFENDHDKPGRDTLIAIAGYYGVSTDWLASGDGEKRSPYGELLSSFEWLPAEKQQLVIDLCKSLASAEPRAPDATPTGAHQEPRSVKRGRK